MATRTEELQNLQHMKITLENIKTLKERKNKIEENIKNEQSRYLQINTYFDYPEFSPSNYKEKAQKSINSKTRIRSICISLIMTIPIIFFYIVSFVVLCIGNGITSFADLIFCLIFVPPLLIAFIPYAGLPISAFIHILGGAFWGFYIFLTKIGEIPATESDYMYMALIIFYLCAAAVLIVSYIIWWASYLISKRIVKKRDKKIICQAMRKDEDEKKDYETSRESAKTAFYKKQGQKRTKLYEEAKINIATLNVELTEIIEKLEHYEKSLREIPGLAPEDKNKHTVDTLISYFERGKADSIKEAINIFDNEKTLQFHLEREREDRLREASERRDALRRMAEEQEEHNERMREKADEYRKKLDRAIDEIKFGK